MSHVDSCVECGGYLLTREERREGLCEHHLFAREWDAYAWQRELATLRAKLQDRWHAKTTGAQQARYEGEA